MFFERMPKQKHGPQHVSETDAAFQSAREEVSHFEKPDSYAFGELELDTIDTTRDWINRLQSRGVDDSKYQEEIIQLLLALKKTLTEKFILQEELDGFIEFFREASDLQEARDFMREWEAEFKNRSVSESTQLPLLFLENKIPLALFEKMLRNHLSLHEIQQDSFNEHLPDLFADFRESVEKKIKEGVLPISVEALESRMARTKVYLGDPVQGLTDYGGEYDTLFDTVRIAPQKDPLRERHCFFHEMLHAISGQTILERNEALREGTPQILDYRYQRKGLRFIPAADRKKQEGERFRWLDEAVTEELALHLSNFPEGVYINERRLLDELSSKGLPRKLVYAAYFESYNPNDKGVPAWKELVERLRAVDAEPKGIAILKQFEKKNKATRLQEKEELDAAIQRALEEEERDDKTQDL